jgi:hypothetical protein
MFIVNNHERVISMKGEKEGSGLSSSTISLCILFVFAACNLKPIPVPTFSPTINPFSLQQENASPFNPMLAGDSGELQKNHIGVHFEDYNTTMNWTRITRIIHSW